MDRRRFCRTAAGSLGGLAAGAAFGQASNQKSVPEVGLFDARTFKSAGGETLPYRLFVPKPYNSKKSYPLVVWLHGGAGRGVDNLKQITGGNTAGATIWVKSENQTRNPCIVVAPQCPENREWTNSDRVSLDATPTPSLMEKMVDAMTPSEYLLATFELIESLSKTLRIDANRIYISGQSMGGFGTWALIAAYPERFAAAVPLCGGGTPANASRLTKLAIWAFHGDKDPVVPVSLTRRMIEEIKKAGGHPKYTELQGAGHLIWEQVFGDPELMPWVFAQRRTVK